MRIIALLIALLGATASQGFAQDDISTSTGIIGNGRLLGAKTYDGQTTVGILGIDSSGNTIIKALSGSDVLFAGTIKLANNTYLQARNAAGSADVDVLKVDANDDTVLTSDSGDPVIVQAGGDPQRLFTFSGSSDTALTLKFGDGGTTATQSLVIQSSTPDGDDDSYVCLASGSTCSRSGGAYAIFNGNELPSVGGDVEIGTGANSADSIYFNEGASGTQTGVIDSSGFRLPASGTTISIQEATGSTACMGLATPNGTTPVTVTTSCAATGSRVFYARAGAVTNMGTISTTTSGNGTSFTFASTGASDTLASSVVWWIIKESA